MATKPRIRQKYDDEKQVEIYETEALTLEGRLRETARKQ